MYTGVGKQCKGSPKRLMNSLSCVLENVRADKALVCKERSIHRLKFDQNPI